MVPQQSEDQPSLLGNAREPPHLEGVLHVTGQIMASGIKDVAVRAPDGSVGQFDSVRNDQLRQQGVAPGFENMQIPVPMKHAEDAAGQDSGKDESQRDYGPMGQREVDVNRRVNKKDMDQKAGDQAVDMDEYHDDKQNDAQQPAQVKVHY